VKNLPTIAPSKLPELFELEKLIQKGREYFRVEVLDTVETQNLKFPIYSICIGSEDKTKPTLGLFGGVHGLERIGTQCIMAFFESLIEQLAWDVDLRERLKNVRLVSIPMVNPAGMYLGRRSNPQGVDLMRNSPTEAVMKPAFLVGGHRISPTLPWYRGKAGAEMEVESRVLLDFVRREMFQSEASMALDAHSGFGLKDRLWFPYAKTTETFARIEEAHEFKNLLTRSYPNHVYTVEAQSLNYTTHGDLWDFLFDEHFSKHGKKGPMFIPWTLEMGSWMWVRKNPIQLLSSVGHFNPVKMHRKQRALRRHLTLFDFFLRAIKNHTSWTKK